MLALLTGVERVAIDFGTRWQRDMARLTVSDAARLLDEGEFPPGSMGPKIESAVRFVTGGGRTALITSAERLVDAVEGGGGTRIVPDAEGPSAGASEASCGGSGVSWSVRVIPNRYADSVRLMGVARALRDRDGVRACELAMGTPANLEALERLGVTRRGRARAIS